MFASMDNDRAGEDGQLRRGGQHVTVPHFRRPSWMGVQSKPTV
jgi:hypothetical protein